MKQMQVCGSLIRKYVLGYLVLGIFSLVCLILAFGCMFSQSGQYSKALRTLTDANDLERSLEDLNSSVNLAYLWLSETGNEGYSPNRERVNIQIAQIEKNLEEQYIREMDDTVQSIRTYIEHTDLLLEDLEASVQQNQKNFDSLEGLYGETQEMYAYSLSFLQSGFQVMLGSVERLKRNFVRTQKLLLLLVAAVITTGGFFVCIYLLHFFRNTASAIQTLKQGMEAVQENVESAKTISIRTGDELEGFADTFNEMLGMIQEQMKKLEENADIQERLAEMEIENLRIFGELQESHLHFLQSRINPHFLFNTLNMISSMARMENADTCAEMMEITASFLRYNLNNITNTVSLDMEIANLKDYVAIQKYRYGERYQYRFEIEEDCLGFSMPCMILQPLVENAIQHGVAMMTSGGFVRIHVYRRKDRVLFEICDNGRGMTEEQIQKIQEDFRQHKPSDNHIGLRNIYSRLNLYYNGNLSFELTPQSPGLLIAISLPWKEQTYETDNGAG